MIKIPFGRLPFMFALVSAALFGLATPVSKHLLNGINPFLLAGLLYLGASLVLLPVILKRKELPPLFDMDRNDLGRLSGAVVLGGVLGPILMLFALRYAPASSVAMWLNLELVATAALGYLFFRDHLGGRGWLGVVAALASGLVLTINEGGSGMLSGVLVASACVCWGLDNHLTALVDGISAIQSTFVKGLFAGTINTIIGVLPSGQSVPAGFIVCSLMLGGVSYGASIVLYIVSSQKIGATRSQIIFSSAPFFGVFFSVILLSESVSLLQAVSFLLLVMSIALFASERHEHYHDHQAREHTHLHGHDDLHHAHAHDKEIALHEHSHGHGAYGHSHPHWPDIHHRHEHG